MSASTHSEGGNFRSVLPHEPLFDIDRYDKKGFLHLQGAFEPKRKKSSSLNVKEEDKNTKPSSSEPHAPDCYWKSSDELRSFLLLALGQDHERLQLPYPVEGIHVLDSAPPYNKVRLIYATPQQALHIQHVWRSLKISPHDLFSTITSDDDDTHTPIQFGSHPFTATVVTTKPLPPNSWSRSNPPKFRRLLHDRNDATERSKTRFVYVSGLLGRNSDNNSDSDNANAVQDDQIKGQKRSFWRDLYAVQYVLRQVFGKDIEVFISKKQHENLVKACHLGFRTAQDAQRAVQEFQGVTITWEYSAQTLQSAPMFLDYVTVTQKSKAKHSAWEQGTEIERGEASRPECTSTTHHITIPGLVIVEDYLSEGEEQALMAALTGPQAPWSPEQINKSETGAVKRRVQHYGYVFDYQTADVLRDRCNQPGANCPPLPAVRPIDNSYMDDLVKEGRGWDVLARVIEKTRKYRFDIPEGDDHDDHCAAAKKVSFPDLNQLTVNQYRPGEGIGSHVDTPSAFGDGLISVSLSSGIVMEFRKDTSQCALKSADSTISDSSARKMVYLPPRSLVLLSGPARYEWEHQIVTRRTDTHQGTVIPRGLRISLTLRTALALDGKPMPRVESHLFPPTWEMDDTEKSKSRNALATPDTERDHVHAVYDAIATQWHHTRGKRGVLWPGATQFLQNLPFGSIVADIGCGDGKYFPAIWEAGSFVIGTDISRPLLETAFAQNASSQSNGEKVADARKVSSSRQTFVARPAVAVADCMSVPLRTSSCDAAICIAVMHHLSTLERRIRCIEELVRIVRPGGYINVQAWAMEQDKDSRRRFAGTDVFVPFNAQPKYLDKVSSEKKTPSEPASTSSDTSKSVAELYSETYANADFDERKGLVVFQRYCHLYREGEMEEIARQVDGVQLTESGYESGNYFIILRVT